MIHIYFGIENLALNEVQRADLVQALRAMGPKSNPQPACLNHWRTRLDGQAAIFEALFAKENITIDAFKGRLATTFGVDPTTIGHSVSQVVFVTRESAAVTFSRTGTDYLRVVFFGYDGGEDWPTWMESGNECRGYLATYRDEWEEAA